MERCSKPPSYEQPSFSSTLLDSIYRSMDESDGTEVTEKRGLRGYEEYGVYKRDSSGLSTHNHYRHDKLNVRTRPEQVANRNRSGWAHSTSSSSDCSSYGGFSSSEAESVRLKPIRTTYRSDPVQSQYRYPVQSPSNCERDSKKKSSSVKNKLKEFRKSSNKQQMPSSPGAKLASFLNVIFAKKGSKTVDSVRKVSDQQHSSCSTASSYTRSCLSKTPSTTKRSVRFCPATVSDSRPCSGDGDRRKRVEEILRGIERGEEEDEESDASSDLFELEDLTVGIGRRFRDELPVYGTTSLANKTTPSHLRSTLQRV